MTGRGRWLGDTCLDRPPWSVAWVNAVGTLTLPGGGDKGRGAGGPTGLARPVGVMVLGGGGEIALGSGEGDLGGGGEATLGGGGEAALGGGGEAALGGGEAAAGAGVGAAGVGCLDGGLYC